MPSVNLEFVRGYRIWKAGQTVPIKAAGNKSPLTAGVADLLVKRGWAKYANKPSKSTGTSARKRTTKRAADSGPGKAAPADLDPSDGN